MTPEITDEDDKVVRLEVRKPAPPKQALTSEIIFHDELLMVTRLTYRFNGEVWHEHILHEFEPDDDWPDAS